MKQPNVIGEITAGIFLGPNILGYFLPEVSNFMFPASSMTTLQLFSQIGLILFMFVIGMELDFKFIKSRAKETLFIGLSGIFFPFLLGAGTSIYLYNTFLSGNASLLTFSLFMGISLSITAFPVLARILQERNMTKTQVGKIAIGCAALNDIVAWCLLAVVIVIAKAGDTNNLMITFFLIVIFIFIMLFIVKPLMNKFYNSLASKGNLNKNYMAVFFLIMIVSAYISEIIGIHSLFGAFIAGLAMPDNHEFRLSFTEKIEDVSLVLFLPLFFVFTGLNTNFDLITNPNIITAGIIIICVAIIGKFGFTAISARITKFNIKDSLLLGALMNTRGLMELVVLNIGLELGIINRPIYSIMVIMTFTTTFMTAPLLHYIEAIWSRIKKREKIC